MVSQKELVIVGGGFAGSYVARTLEKDSRFKVTLIDPKDYFEYTPSILKLSIDKHYIRNIRRSHTRYLKKTQVIRDYVKTLEKNKLILESGKKVSFHYLVLATGGSYTKIFDSVNLVVAGHADNLIDSEAKIKQSENILIIGGGLVGTELAGEILTEYPSKKVTLIHSEGRLMHRNHSKSILNSERQLKKLGLNIIYSDRIKDYKKGVYYTQKGKSLKPDLAFLSIGPRPNTAFLKKNFSDKLTSRNQVRVNPQLQMKGTKNVFIAGDITDIKEEKTAHNAEMHAKTIVKNIQALENKTSLQTYKSTGNILLISLGQKRAIFENKNKSFKGMIPSWMKKLVEMKIIWQHS